MKVNPISAVYGRGIQPVPVKRVQAPAPPKTDIPPVPTSPKEVGLKIDLKA